MIHLFALICQVSLVFENEKKKKQEMLYDIFITLAFNDNNQVVYVLDDTYRM